MTNATFSHRPPFLPVTRLRLGRAILLLGLTLVGMVAGTIWLLTTKAHPIAMPTLDSTAWPPWLKQSQAYPAPEVKPPPASPAPAPDLSAAQLAALRAQLEEQRQALEALKAALRQRPAGAATATGPRCGRAQKDVRPPCSLSGTTRQPTPRRPPSTHWPPAPRSCRVSSKRP